MSDGVEHRGALVSHRGVKAEDEQAGVLGSIVSQGLCTVSRTRIEAIGSWQLAVGVER